MGIPGHDHRWDELSPEGRHSRTASRSYSDSQAERTPLARAAGVVRSAHPI